MAYYEVRTRLNDSINGYEFLRGEFVETNDTAWVGRWGKTLRKVENVPASAKPSPVVNTVEQKSVVVEEVKEVVEEVKEEPKKTTRATTRGRMSAPMDKVVKQDDSEKK